MLNKNKHNLKTLLKHFSQTLLGHKQLIIHTYVNCNLNNELLHVSSFLVMSIYSFDIMYSYKNTSHARVSRLVAHCPRVILQVHEPAAVILPFISE